MAKYNSIIDAIYAKVDDFISKGIIDKSAKSATIQECLNKISLLSLDNISNPEAAGALAEKNKEYDMVISDQIALLLESFLSTIDEDKNKDYDVRFIGMNGDVIYGYSKDEFLALTELPPNPIVEGFTSQGWNWDFEDAQAYVTKYGKLNVGQMYIPSDGKTHMILGVGVRKTIPLMIQQTVSEGVTINWGDGSEEETIEGTGTVTTYHTYETEGEYEITLDVTDECTLDFGGTVNETACNVFGESTTRLHSNSLKKIYIGNSVTSIRQNAFANCYALLNLTIFEGITSIDQQAFVNCHGITALTIPDSVTSIGAAAFAGCLSLTALSLSYGVTSIGQGAFSSSYVLNNLTIPDSVTSIGQQTFSSSYVLTNLTIPDSVTTIGNSAFSNCNAIFSLTIPDSITSIGTQTFSNCRNLYFLTILAETPPTLANVNAFNEIAADCTIYVPHGTGDTYKAASGWSTWASQIQELPE